MSGAVDVLAMLKQGAQVAEHNGFKGDARDFERAHAAVAELIEAAAALADSQGGPWERGNAYISARGAGNMNAAMKKVRAAVANVQGVQP